MTIDEAIFILRDLDTRRLDFTNGQIYEAKELGIEALKYIREWRIPPHGGAKILLPRETEE